MSYTKLKGPLLEVLKAPTEPPEPPPGAQSSVQIFRASKNFLRYQMIVWGFGGGISIMFAFALMVIGAFEDDSPREAILGWLLLALSIPAIFIKYFLIRLDYDMRYYVVTDRSLRIRQGAVTIHEGTYTFANIQNLKINQGPLERLMGIANLVVETAGGAGSSSREQRRQNPFAREHEGVLRGIDNAPEVRDQILRLLKRYRDAGLGDPEDRAREVPVAVPSAGLSQAAVERLREIRDEVRHLRHASAG
jgi:membrane protein YdbS with pleckstrin-like domain